MALCTGSWDSTLRVRILITSSSGLAHLWIIGVGLMSVRHLKAWRCLSYPCRCLDVSLEWVSCLLYRYLFPPYGSFPPHLTCVPTVATESVVTRNLVIHSLPAEHERYASCDLYTSPPYSALASRYSVSYCCCSFRFPLSLLRPFCVHTGSHYRQYRSYTFNSRVVMSFVARLHASRSLGEWPGCINPRAAEVDVSQ